MNAVALKVDALSRDFPVGRRTLRAVDSVSFALHEGETLGVVGESGCGKSTLARMILKLIPPTSGRIAWLGEDVTELSERHMRPRRRHLQAVFQDPMSSLNPRHKIGRILIEPILLHGLASDRAAALALVHDVLDRVGLSRGTVDRYSYELSGGQRQRVGIARAVVLRLLQELTREMHLALAFISHDLSVIRSICQRVVVMREGRVVEEGVCEQVFAAPAAAYTRMLIDAIPLPAVDPGWLTRGASVEAAATA